MSFLENPASIAAHPLRPTRGRISLVGAGPGSADLLTLRTLHCLQAADIVFDCRLAEW